MTSDPTDRPTGTTRNADGPVSDPTGDQPTGNATGAGDRATDALTARLALIDALPLDERAASFTALHAELTEQMSPPTTKDTPND